MAVVTKYGTGYKDPTAVKTIEGIFAEAVDRSINSQVTVTTGDNATSQYFIGRVPSSALISPGASLYGPAAASLTSVSLGFVGAATALMSAVNMAAGGAFAAVPAVGAANYIKRAWQLAGLSSDPGGMLDIFMTIGVDAAQTSAIHAHIPFKKTA